jgi:asparagine synthase (glutamine-hydrolysing)
LNPYSKYLLVRFDALQISDKDFKSRNVRFPVNTPETKEYYLLRSLFEENYPEPCALATVPTGKSIACSTPEVSPTSYWSRVENMLLL